MTNIIKSTIRKIINRYGYELIPIKAFPGDFTKKEITIIRAVSENTMTGPERLVALIRAVSYVVRHQIPGDFVECGVWRGGSMMAVAHTLLDLNFTERELYLFDTFAGMSKPTEVDGRFANEKFDQTRLSDKSSEWANAGLDEVKQALFSTGYDRSKIHFIPGLVEETLPSKAPESIALLRLDTDWYESTKHELEHLYPRLSVGGVLIIDDYGRWPGARQATNEYLAENHLRLFLNRIDVSGRLVIKLEQ